MAEAGRAGGQAGATTMVGAAISKDIRDRCTMGSSTSHLRRCRNSRTHGNSSNSSSSRTSRNFHSRTDHPVNLHGVSFVPDLGFNLFSFHVVQEKHEIILNKTGAHLLNGRIVFPRRSNGSSLRATRVMPGAPASARNAIAKFTDPLPLYSTVV